jgi:hypothetical protein
VSTFSIPPRALGVAAATALLALALPGAAAHANADQDSVTESGNQGIADFTVDARNAGTTTDTPASGTFDGRNAFLHFSGPITCLDVEGNRAGFIYPIDAGSTPEAAVGQSVWVTVEDNGAAGDKMGFVGPAAIPPNGPCQPLAAPLAITGPGVTVHDAP